MSEPYDCVLTLSVPEHLEEDLLDLLLLHEDLVSGFSVQAAEGLGSGAPLHTALERVRGRSNRRFITLLMREQDTQPLIARLKNEVATPDIAWWTMPVTGFGRLA